MSTSIATWACGRKQILEDLFSQPDLGDAVAQQNQMPLRIHHDFLHVQRAAYAGGHLLEFLNRGRLRKWNHHRHVRFEVRALLRTVVGDEDQAFTDGRQERIRGGFERQQRVAIVCVGQLKPDGAGGLVLRIEQNREMQTCGHLLP